jgi:phage repressor protein C with HTH and peptisase S24 domain
MKETTQEKSQVKQKILLYLQEKGVSQHEFYKKSGVTRGILTQNNGISEDNIARFLDYAQDVNVEWLLRGEGEMIRKFEASSKDVAADDGLSSDDSTHLAHVADTSEGIPLIPFEAMAGAFTGELSAMDYECQRLVIPGVRADYVIAIGGDSMRPNFHSGDMVACSIVSLSDIFFQWGRVYIIDTAQGALLKRVRPGSSPATVTLISDNPDYAPFEVERTDIYHIALVRALVRIE